MSKFVTWNFGPNKFFRRIISENERAQIIALGPGERFQNEGNVKWLSVHKYEDGEYLVSLDQLGECYYEQSSDNKRFGENFQIRFEKPEHVIYFLDKTIMDDRFFLK